MRHSSTPKASPPWLRRTRFYTRQEKILPLNQLPANIIDLAQGTHLDLGRLLSGSGIFIEDIGLNDRCISCEQLLRLVQNLNQLSNHDDMALRLGRRLLYSGDSQLQQALQLSPSVYALLDTLCEFNTLFLPMLHLNLISDGDYHYLSIHDSLGLGQQADFFYQACMSSIIALLKAQRIDSQHLHFFLPSQGQEPELHTYLGSHLHLQAPIALIALPTQLGEHPLNDTSAWLHAQAVNRCRQHRRVRGLSVGFLEHLQNYLLRSIPNRCTNLESVSEYYQISPATLKRRLNMHDTRFQVELDRANKRLALAALVVEGLSSEQTAEKLRINDTANFRRAFKRWTGLAPSHLKKGWI